MASLRLSSCDPGSIILSLAYRATRRVLGSVAVLFRRHVSKDAELLVVRHENGSCAVRSTGSVTSRSTGSGSRRLRSSCSRWGRTIPCGSSPDPGRVGQARSPDRFLDGVGDPACGWDRSCAAAVRSDVEAVPHCPSPRQALPASTCQLIRAGTLIHDDGALCRQAISVGAGTGIYTVNESRAVVTVADVVQTGRPGQLRYGHAR